MVGYVGPFSEHSSCIGFSTCYLAVVDRFSETHYFETDRNTYSNLLHALNELHLKHDECAYIWLRQDDNGRLIESNLFKSTLNIDQVCYLFERSYDHGSTLNLLHLTESITMDPLKDFVREVITDRSLMKDFIQIPASKRHHHSFPGGLFSHSLEVALLTRQTVKSLSGVSINEMEVAMVAALFHDIGKTKTLGMESHTDLGRLMDHEQFTLALLIPHLERLSEVWPKGYDALQYLLTWKESMGLCRFVSGNAIKMADRLSTSASIRDMAFKDKPNYFSFSSLCVGAKTHYVNRLN